MNVFFMPEDDPRCLPGFFAFICDVNGSPFGAMINKSLLDRYADPQYPWLWVLKLPVQDLDPLWNMPTDTEMMRLNGQARQFVDLIGRSVDILYVGTTVHKGNFEMMFVGREEDTAAIGGAIYALPDELPELRDQEFQFRSERDAEWRQINGLYEVLRQIGQS